jgi:hypothetical protein
MLASLAALHLVLLTQASDPSAQPAPPDAPAQPSAPEAAPPGENPPLPGKAPSRRPEGATGAPATPERAAPRAAAATPAGDTRSSPAPRQLSLLSGESLGGGSISLAWAGWSSLGIAYGQGVTAADDLAAVLDFDWADTELRLGGLYRRAFGPYGGFEVAGRFGASWYKDLGATWIRSGNFSAHGLELAPGLSVSSRSGSGLLSVLVEAPLTITLKYDGGLLFRPRLSVAYEAPVYTDLYVGARAGIGYRGGSGDAPLKAGRADLTFVVLAGYQLL